MGRGGEWSTGEKWANSRRVVMTIRTCPVNGVAVSARPHAYVEQYILLGTIVIESEFDRRVASL